MPEVAAELNLTLQSICWIGATRVLGSRLGHSVALGLVLGVIVLKCTSYSLAHVSPYLFFLLS